MGDRRSPYQRLEEDMLDFMSLASAKAMVEYFNEGVKEPETPRARRTGSGCPASNNSLSAMVSGLLEGRRENESVLAFT